MSSTSVPTAETDAGWSVPAHVRKRDRKEQLRQRQLQRQQLQQQAYWRQYHPQQQKERDQAAQRLGQPQPWDSISPKTGSASAVSTSSESGSSSGTSTPPSPGPTRKSSVSSLESGASDSGSPTHAEAKPLFNPPRGPKALFTFVTPAMRRLQKIENGKTGEYFTGPVSFKVDARLNAGGAGNKTNQTKQAQPTKPAGPTPVPQPTEIGARVVSTPGVAWGGCGMAKHPFQAVSLSSTA